MKIVLIGSNGFVGRNIAEQLKTKVELIKTSRNPISSDYLRFDFTDISSWERIVDIAPDLIINSAAYGVVKSELDLKQMYDINYFLPVQFYQYLQKAKLKFYWLQLGTAFEYDLSIEGGITETSPCIPQTHYGISKLQFTNFLINKAEPDTFSVFRPFGMFGKYENESKFFPMLIKAQKIRKPVKLSKGTQERDYFLVDDLGIFIAKLIVEDKFQLLPNILNLGSCQAHSFIYLSKFIEDNIPDFDKSLWLWGSLPFREGESKQFFNESKLAASLGFQNIYFSEAFKETIQYYYR